jgi:hypothetical protein
MLLVSSSRICKSPLLACDGANDRYVDWRVGAEWFEMHLVDYDTCSKYVPLYYYNQEQS